MSDNKEMKYFLELSGVRERAQISPKAISSMINCEELNGYEIERGSSLLQKNEGIQEVVLYTDIKPKLILTYRIW